MALPGGFRGHRRRALRARVLHRRRPPDAEARHRPAGRHPGHAVARTADGEAPPRDQLVQAQQIIEQRVNGLGVSGAEVVARTATTSPSRCRVTRGAGPVARPDRPAAVPAGDRSADLGRARRACADHGPTPAPSGAATPAPSTAPGRRPAPGASAHPEAAGRGRRRSSSPSSRRPPRRRCRRRTPPPAPAPTPATATAQAPAATQGAGSAAPGRRPAARSRRSRPPRPPGRARRDHAAGRPAALDCAKPDPLTGYDDPKLPLVTCNQDGTAKYVLGAVVPGGHRDRRARRRPTNGQGVGWTWSTLTFKSEARRDTWGNVHHRARRGARVAFILDGEVVSAPDDPGRDPRHDTQITGQFSQAQAPEPGQRC